MSKIVIKSYVYKLYNDLDNEFYIGSTIQTPHIRFIKHKNDSKRFTNKLYKKIKSQGVNHWFVESLQIYENIDIDELRLKEQEYIDKLNPQLNECNSYNDELRNRSDRLFKNKDIDGNILFSIYLLYNDIDNDTYIGSTINNVNIRFNRHKIDSYKSNAKIHIKMKEQGVEHWWYKTLEELKDIDIDELRIKEQEYIDKLKPSLNIMKSYNKKTRMKSLRDRGISVSYIFKLYNNIDDEFFIGCTIHDPKDELENYKNNIDGKTNLNKKMQELGIDYWNIEILEEFKHISKVDLLQKQNEYIDKLNPSLNILTSRQEYQKTYYKDNKDWKNARKKEVIWCECGISSVRGSIRRHENTNRHKERIKLIESGEWLVIDDNR